MPVMYCLKFFNLNKPPIDYKLTTIPDGFIKLERLQQKCLLHLKYLFKMKSYFQNRSISIHNMKRYEIEIFLQSIKLEFSEMHVIITCFGSNIKELKARHYNRLAFLILFLVVAKKNLDELTNWFIQVELMLFRLRFILLPIEEQLGYLLENKLAGQPLTVQDKTLVEESNSPVSELYKVPWTYVFNLVSRKRIVLRNGFAFIEREHLTDVATAVFKKQLNRLFVIAKKGLPRIELDVRMKELSTNIGNVLERILSTPKDNFSEDLKLSELPQVVDDFPPCMLRIYRRLHNKHHLRFEGRRQLILFLKDIGLDVDSSVEMLRQNFVNVMTEEQFHKDKLPYFVRHLYGLKGSRIKYSSYSCEDMLNSKESNCNDCNGCPLNSAQIADNYIKDLTTDENYAVKRYVNEQSPKLACSVICNGLNGLPIEAMKSPLDFYSMRRRNHSALSENSSD